LIYEIGIVIVFVPTDACCRLTGVVAAGIQGRQSMSQQQETETDKLLTSDLRVVNIGLREFARDLSACKIQVIHVDWSPPAVTNPKVASLLAKLGG
jgi:FdrA protein